MEHVPRMPTTGDGNVNELKTYAVELRERILKMDMAELQTENSKAIEQSNKADREAIKTMVKDGFIAMRYCSFWKWKAGIEKFIESRKDATRKTDTTYARLAIAVAVLACEGFDCSELGHENHIKTIARRLVEINKGDKKTSPTFKVNPLLLEHVQTVVSGKATYKDENGIEHVCKIADLNNDTIQRQVIPLTLAEQKAEKESARLQKINEKSVPWAIGTFKDDNEKTIVSRVTTWLNKLKNDEKTLPTYQLIVQAVQATTVKVVEPTENKKAKEKLAQK